jgi:hypothetical protein
MMKAIILFLCLAGCANPVPEDQPVTSRCPAELTAGCSGNQQFVECLPNQTLDQWVEQMDTAENGNTDQPI